MAFLAGKGGKVQAAPIDTDAARAAYAQWLQGQTGQTLDQYREGRDAETAQAQADMDNEPGTLESVARGGLQGVTMGFSDEIGGALKAAFKSGGTFGERYRKERDAIREANDRARKSSPIAYGVGDILGGLVPTVATAGAGAAAEAGTVARAALSGAAQGAASGVGYSDEQGVGGILKDAAKGAVIGGATGALAGKATSSAVEGAEDKALKQFTQNVTEGADPTFRKRFLGQSDKFARGDKTAQAATAKEILEADPEMNRLLSGKHASEPKAASDVVDHAREKLNELSDKVKPIYEKLDEGAGKVPMADVTDWLDDAIDKARATHGQRDIADVLTEVRGNFVDAELAKPMNKDLAKRLADPKTAEDAAKEIAQIEVSHQDIRKWVTGLLEHKSRVMGALNETERFKLANEAHRVADNFLKAQLEAVAQTSPDLAPQVAKLRELNKEIAVYAGTKQLFEHKATKSLMRQLGPQQGANDRMHGLIAAVGALAHGPAGVFQALGVSAGAKAAAQGARTLDRVATNALAKVVKAARQGDPTAALVQRAIEAGVPASAVNAALAVYRNTDVETSP